MFKKYSTPSYMVYGESGRYPLYATVYSRIISYWTDFIRHILNSFGFSNFWTGKYHNILKRILFCVFS